MELRNQFLRAESPGGLTDEQIKSALKATLDSAGELRRILIIPPDITRLNAYAGEITRMIWNLLPDTEIDIMPALGTHMPMDGNELDYMFPGIPHDRFLIHEWRTGNVRLGVVPASYIEEISEQYMHTPIEVEVDRRVIDRDYDLVISVGQVVPHEVVGMANYNKNIFVGCGGRDIINYSHYLGAVYGMERMMGKADTPVRRVLNYAEDHFLAGVKLMYALTVTTTDRDDTVHVHSLALGRGFELFADSVEVSQEMNITFVDRPLMKCVVYLKPEEFRTTWVGNKSIYRTRMAMADGGELLILAPGVRAFGEDKENDRLIAKYGYVGRDRVVRLVEEEAELQDALGVAAHLIHGSSEGRFQVTYAPGHLGREAVEAANLGWAPLDEMLERYNPENLQDGWNLVDGEEIYFISNPALGLWAEREKFYGPDAGRESV